MFVYWIIGIVLFLAIAFIALAYMGFTIAIVRPKKKKPPRSEYKIARELVRAKNNAYLYSLNPEDVFIKSSDGLNLKAWLLPSKTVNRRFVICVHGYIATDRMNSAIWSLFTMMSWITIICCPMTVLMAEARENISASARLTTRIFCDGWII